MVCAPERATMSVKVKPLGPKASLRLLMLEDGAGRALLARASFAVVESLLPSPTVHVGPPNCK
jgi:hypothetical protein